MMNSPVPLRDYVPGADNDGDRFAGGVLFFFIPIIVSVFRLSKYVDQFSLL